MKKSKSIKLFKGGDLLLGFLLFAIGYLIVFRLNPGGADADKAFIQIDNTVKYELTLTRNQIIELKEFSPPVTVEIHENAIRVIRNDCEQKICLKIGYISKPGEMIVCVPKKILIYIPFSNEQKGVIKAITG